MESLSVGDDILYLPTDTDSGSFVMGEWLAAKVVYVRKEVHKSMDLPYVNIVYFDNQGASWGKQKVLLAEAEGEHPTLGYGYASMRPRQEVVVATDQGNLPTAYDPGRDPKLITLVLRPGQVVKINGIPITLEHYTQVHVPPENVPLMFENRVSPIGPANT